MHQGTEKSRQYTRYIGISVYGKSSLHKCLQDIGMNFHSEHLPAVTVRHMKIVLHPGCICPYQYNTVLKNPCVNFSVKHIHKGYVFIVSGLSGIIYQRSSGFVLFYRFGLYLFSSQYLL